MELPVGPLLATFDTGFNLYSCTRGPESGDIDPPPRMEVKGAFYISADEFDQQEWRYPGQSGRLQEMLRRESSQPLLD